MMNLFNEARFGGVRIVESATVPAVAVAEVPAASLLSGRTRERLNSYLLHRYGTHYPAVVIASTMYVHPTQAGALRDRLAAISGKESGDAPDR